MERGKAFREWFKGVDGLAWESAGQGPTCGEGIE